VGTWVNIKKNLMALVPATAKLLPLLTVVLILTLVFVVVVI